MSKRRKRKLQRKHIQTLEFRELLQKNPGLREPKTLAVRPAASDAGESGGPDYESYHRSKRIADGTGIY